MIQVIERHQSLKIISNDMRIKKAMEKFHKLFTEYKNVYDYKLGRNKLEVSYIYSGGNPHKNEWFININTLNLFITMIKGYGVTLDEITFESNPQSPTIDINLEVKCTDIPREYQDRYVDALLDGQGHAKLVDLQMGKGKTYIANTVISIIKKRTLFLLLPMYIKKWIKDLNKHFHLDDGDIITVNGKEELVALLSNNTTAKFILLSNKTWANYISDYEVSVDDVFFDTPLPENICQNLGVATVVIDEVHRELYSVFKAMLYLDPKLLIGLSATLLAKDPVRKTVQKTLFDNECRLSLLPYDPYTNVTAVNYRFRNPIAINKHSQTKMGYSHINFEDYILKRGDIKTRYFEMIKKQLDIYYINMMRDGERAVVFCSRRNMCTELTLYLRNAYPHLDVRRFVGQDPQSNLYDPDIRVTTIKSGGEAVDIADLIAGFLTVNIDSEVANLQALGRLRPIEDKEVNYIFMWSNEIKSHRTYYDNKRKIFDGKIKSFTDESYNDGHI